MEPGDVQGNEDHSSSYPRWCHRTVQTRQGSTQSLENQNGENLWLNKHYKDHNKECWKEKIDCVFYEPVLVYYNMYKCG